MGETILGCSSYTVLIEISNRPISLDESIPIGGMSNSAILLSVKSAPGIGHVLMVFDGTMPNKLKWAKVARPWISITIINEFGPGIMILGRMIGWAGFIDSSGKLLEGVHVTFDEADCRLLAVGICRQ